MKGLDIFETKVSQGMEQTEDFPRKELVLTTDRQMDRATDRATDITRNKMDESAGQMRVSEGSGERSPALDAITDRVLNSLRASNSNSVLKSDSKSTVLNSVESNSTVVLPLCRQERQSPVREHMPQAIIPFDQEKVGHEVAAQAEEVRVTLNLL